MSTLSLHGALPIGPVDDPGHALHVTRNKDLHKTKNLSSERTPLRADRNRICRGGAGPTGGLSLEHASDDELRASGHQHREIRQAAIPALLLTRRERTTQIGRAHV